jgi:hypothetical protein
MKFINQKFGWLILSLFVLVFQVNAQVNAGDKPVSKVRKEQAYQTLLKVDLFALGGIGYSGEISKGEEALDILLEENELIPAFRKLVKEATPEGKLYALLGLKMLNCECFIEELEDLKKLSELPARKSSLRNVEQGNVRRMMGCIGFQETWSKVLDTIENEKDGIKWKLDSWKKKKQ